MYQAFFALAYYGLFRVGELAKGHHPVKACDVFIATNKRKMLFILRSSKTHNKGNHPQKIRISAAGGIGRTKNKCFCPFQLVLNYLALRGDYSSKQEQFFVLKEGIPLTSSMGRKVLKIVLKRLNMVVNHFNLHSLRSGCMTVLLAAGFPIEEIKMMARWKANAVFRYLRD